MTDTVIILAQKWYRLHSHRVLQSITINREDELFIWVLKAGLARIVYYQSQADTAAEADDLGVISKEALGHSWGILSAILGHKYQNPPERNLQPKTAFDHVCIFPYEYAPLMFDLDLVSEWRLACFCHLGWVEWGYFFLSCTTLVITDFSYFKL